MTDDKQDALGQAQAAWLVSQILLNAMLSTGIIKPLTLIDILEKAIETMEASDGQTRPQAIKLTRLLIDQVRRKHSVFG